ncbi:MAM and LDL-receptor class A domain-containing protein 1 isoform X2 [Nilaparvata lugens]|uniref:MAM and LDL-receptor class A domain-containing protein 1 isoform X2 n=1 Tax=Nilaparvata lugens TaxID=108931 RepID=UPI00193E065E|nr:MAM and LDL-receptor class A domain-containing protein 1 isoform X2 [Nilaparvata lugens]
MYSSRLCRLLYLVIVISVQIDMKASLILRDGEDSRFMSSWGVQCRRLPPVKNSIMRIRNSGRTVRYQCKPGSILLGEKRLVCRGLKWDKEPPQCIRPGCQLDQPTNGHVEPQYQGALARFSCYSGYLLSGSGVLACDGVSWNASVPTCWRNEEETSIGSCDFEKKNDMCGWVNSANDDFDWKLNIMKTPSGPIGTGPSYDHTLGRGKMGQYLYLESSSPQSEHDTAVLVSPYFKPQITSNETRCFTFWYHMYGNGIGKLNVYVNNTLNFTESGSHGNRWIRGIVPLEGDDIFRIKIEGVRGPTYAGDIALDDFALAEGPACEETAPLLGSCNGRCFSDAITDDNACYCTESCQANSTCCSDFYTLCTLESHAPYVISSQQRDSKSANIAVISFFAVLAVVCLVVAVFVFKRRVIRRDRNGFDDDSDVQFLTSDELINFNLARPSPDRQVNSETRR